MLSAVGEDSLMGLKLRDIRLIYRKFQEKSGDTYMMAEELVPQLTGMVGSMQKIKDSVICLDGFTGFTPTQYELLGELLSCCRDMYVTVTTDVGGKRNHVFRISSETIRHLTKRAGERGISVSAPVWTGKGSQHIPYRVADNEELAFLEENLFCFSRNNGRPSRKTYRLFCATENGMRLLMWRERFGGWCRNRDISMRISPW